MRGNVRRAGVLVGLASILAVLLAGCAMPLPIPFTRQADVPFHGASLTPALSVPALALRRADGRAFRTGELRGHVSLLFFGYTYCPDVCPLTLSEVAQVRRLLGPTAQQLDVYFVTIDPARDTPERLGKYVKGFDPAIEALTGDPADLERLRSGLGVVAQRRDAPDGGPNYFMDHTAGLFLVDRSGGVSLFYAYGTPPEQIAEDVGRVLSSRQQSPSATIVAEGAWARAATRLTDGAGGTSAVYLTLKNVGPDHDRLVGASSEVASLTEIHRSTMEAGVMRMLPAGTVDVPAGATVTLAPGGLHVMLIDLHQDLTAGDHLAITLHLERAGDVTVDAEIRAPSAGPMSPAAQSASS